MAKPPAPDLQKLLRVLTHNPARRAGPRRRSRKKQATLGSTAVALVLAAALYVAQQKGWLRNDTASDTREATRPATTPRQAENAGDSDLVRLHAQRAQDVLVEAAGTVVKVLPDDEDGARHQRFLVEVADGLTIKLSHNIDLAPRVPAREGDTLRFRGDYLWNDLGGVVHWTHHDPKQWREGGWIEHLGKRYE